MLRFSLAACLIVIGFCYGHSPGGYPREQKNRALKAEALRLTPFCDLTRNKARYSQQIVRTRAILVSSRRDLVDGGETYLYLPSCKDENSLVVIENDASYSPGPDSLAALERALSKNSTSSLGRARVTVVGRFEGSAKGYGHLGGFRARIVVTNLDQIESVQSTVRWPEHESKH